MRANNRLSIRQRIGLILFGLALSVLVIEIAARILHLMPVDPPDTYYLLRSVVGKLPEPYEYFLYRQAARPLNESEFFSWVHFNYRSLHDIDHDYAVPDNSQRLMFIGDSFTAAWEVPTDQNFVSRLRTSLNDLPGRPNNYDLINAGFYGWGTDREYLYYREDGKRYNSNVVVLQIYLSNDPIDNGIGIFGMPIGEERPYFMLDQNDEPVLVDFPNKAKPFTPEGLGFVDQVR